VDFIDAMTGTNKRVKCIDGSEINLRIHSGLNPGSFIKVPNKGMHMPGGERGDMQVEVVMENPKLSEAQLDMLSKIKSL
jgi:DnaJ-class molecular chaperone